MINMALTTTNSYRAHHNVSSITLYFINSYWISSLNRRTLCWWPVPCDTHIWGKFQFPWIWMREREHDSTLHVLPNVFSCYSIHRSITSLQYCARMSWNFIIICRLIASRERICLNFKSMSNAASADRSVLKDSSIIFFASFSITCQKRKKSKKATNKPSLRVPVTILQKQSGKKGAKHKLVTWDGFPLCVSGSWCPVKNRLSAWALIPPLTQFKMVKRKFF